MRVFVCVFRAYLCVRQCMCMCVWMYLLLPLKIILKEHHDWVKRAFIHFISLYIESEYWKERKKIFYILLYVHYNLLSMFEKILKKKRKREIHTDTQTLSWYTKFRFCGYNTEIKLKKRENIFVQIPHYIIFSQFHLIGFEIIKILMHSKEIKSQVNEVIILV